MALEWHENTQGIWYAPCGPVSLELCVPGADGSRRIYLQGPRELECISIGETSATTLEAAKAEAEARLRAWVGEVLSALESR